MKTCPKCKAKYDFNMSFCLEDGSPLEIDEDAVTLEKPGQLDYTSRETSPNETVKPTNDFTQAAKSKKSYVGIIVGLLFLFGLGVLVLAAAIGVWWVSQSRSNDQTVESIPKKPIEESESEPTPTSPAKKGEVTMENYKKVKNGMSYEEVVEIFGEGEEISSTNVAGYSTATYMWKPGTFSNVTLTFQNNKLISKFQMGLK